MRALHQRLSEPDMVQLCQRLRGGASFRSAAQSVGIPWSTFARNMRLARLEAAKLMEGDRTAQRKRAAWAERIDRAYHEGELGLLATIRKGERGWQSCAWILERTRAQYRLTERPESYDLSENAGTEGLLGQALRDRNWSAVVALSATLPAEELEAPDLETAYQSLDLPTRRWLQRRLDEDLARSSG